MKGYVCYYCGQLSEPCEHLAKERHLHHTHSASHADSHGGQVLGYAAEDINAGDVVVLDEGTGRLRRYKA